MNMKDNPPIYWRLDEDRVPRPTDFDGFAAAFGGDRRVAIDHIGDTMVSTVFLCIDHGMGMGGAPVLFETMVFGGPLEGEQDRYSTWEDAAAGHAAMLERVRAAQSA